MKNKKLLVSLLAGFLAAIMLLSLIIGLIPGIASATESSDAIREQIDELEKQQEELEKQKKALRAQIGENLSEMEAIAAEKSVIDQEIFLINEQILNINSQISAYALLIADKQDELDIAQEKMDELSEKNKERIRAMEENGELSYWSVLFEANSFSDLLDRLDMIEEIAAADRRRLNEMREAAEKVAKAQEALEEGKAQLEGTKAELNAMQAELEAKRVEADTLLAQLVAKGMEFEDMLDQAEADTEDLLAEIAKKEEEFDEAKHREYLEWLATSVPPTTKPKPTAPKPNKEPDKSYTDGITWYMPVNYIRLSSPYGWRIHPVYGDRRFHSGVDLAANSGTPIYATRGGTVTKASYNNSAGYYVTINHGDGFSSSYLHMTHYIVSEGQKVSAGQVIGYVGSTGTSTGPHLHFTLYYNGSTVNPANYINFY